MHDSFFALLLSGPHDYSPLNPQQFTSWDLRKQVVSRMMEMLSFLLAVRTNWMPLPKCGKCEYFTDTPDCRLFKAHNIQNHLFLPAYQTPSVLHSFHSQRFQSGTQRLSSDNISFYLEREVRCVCAWILSLITFLMSRFSLSLSRI